MGKRPIFCPCQRETVKLAMTVLKSHEGFCARRLVKIATSASMAA